jgi:hypothetical protein
LKSGLILGGASPLNGSTPPTQLCTIGPDRRRFLRRRLHEAIEQQPEIRAFRRLLLSLGGLELVAPPRPDGDVPRLITAGFVMAGSVKLKIMERSSCHGNISRLWGRKRGGLVGNGTGYALSGDGLWRQHSWGIARQGIVETTQVRVKYFGRLLQGSDAESFAPANG